jgi:hypothetical protein
MRVYPCLFCFSGGPDRLGGKPKGNKTLLFYLTILYIVNTKT